MYIISANSHLNEDGKVTKLTLCRNIDGYPIWNDMSLSYGYISPILFNSTLQATDFWKTQEKRETIDFGTLYDKPSSNFGIPYIPVKDLFYSSIKIARLDVIPVSALTEERIGDKIQFTKMILPSNTNKSIMDILNETINQIIESGYDIESVVTKEIDTSYSSPIIGYLITYTKEDNNNGEN